MKVNGIWIASATKIPTKYGRYPKIKDPIMATSPCEEGCPFFSDCEETCYGFDTWSNLHLTPMKTFKSTIQKRGCRDSSHGQ
jgi:hypothetical protein